MLRYDKIHGDFVDIEVWAQRRASNFVEKAGYYVQGDSLSKPLEHPVTGKTHDSKSAFRLDTRNSGCVEVGNDKPRQAPTMKDMSKGLPSVQEQIYHAMNR